MAPHLERDKLIEGHLTSMSLRSLSDLTSAPRSFEEIIIQLGIDAATVHTIQETRYLNGRDHAVPKSSSLHLAWEYAKDPKDHHRFMNLLRMSPFAFQVLLNMIQGHAVFQNHSNNAQAPVEEQLAVLLYRMGRYGNSAGIEDVARFAGISTGSVINYTDRCFAAIESLHDEFVRVLTREEKEVEKEWVERHVGFGGLWQEGWVMYDGTIAVLASKPGFQGETYYTRKSNYGLNVQIGNIPSNLRIVDYSCGMTGAAHDASAYKHTAGGKYPEWFFSGNEFGWTDSAYACTTTCIPVHKEPASRIRENAIFDKRVSRIRVRSEHCMGALKGRFQCLRGLRDHINSKEDHFKMLRWIRCSIILHNFIIDVEGKDQFLCPEDNHLFDDDDIRPHGDEEDNNGEGDEEIEFDGDGEEKRRQLINELMEYRRQRDLR